jgi:lysozyme
MDIDILVKIKQLIKKHEGLRLRPYLDNVGKLTIGYGRNLDAKGISQSEAETLLANDLAEVYEDLESIFGQEIWDQDPQRIAAIASMRFNLGPTGFREFKRMIAAIKEMNWEEAANQAMDSKWYSQVRNRAREIVDILRGNKSEP